MEERIVPASEADAEVVHTGLRAYNAGFCGDVQDLSFAIRDDKGTCIAGTDTFRIGELIMVDVLWVAESRRGPVSYTHLSGAKAYAELKDRTATIELEAHQRARAIESQAEEKAKKVRTAAEQILYKVQAGYGRLRGDVDATITHASGEMDRVDRALEQVRAEFAEHDAALERLLQSCRECTGCKAPEPLPLEDK